MKLAPWEFDNIKVLVYWYVAAVPLVALLLASLLRQKNLLWRGGALVLLFFLTLAGALDVWRIASRAEEYLEFDNNAQALAALIRERTPPRALILNGPAHNHAVLLTGRRTTLCYAPTVGTHGINPDAREAEVYRIYAGDAEADEIMARLGVDYAVVGPAERENVPELNEAFFERYYLVGEAGGSRLYWITRR